jgi:hypothetical protein
MLILFDHGTPRGLARALPGHTVTTDRRIRYQQNLTRRKIALVNAAQPGSYIEVDIPFV